MKTLFLLLTSCVTFAQSPKEQITKTLDNWHLAAAQVRFDDYMSVMAKDAIYIGTDATENWNKQEFMAFAKPYFDKGKAWSFSVLQRNIYCTENEKIAWFDELLNTQMKICRGSGILVKIGDNWKIQHYVLSMTIPNDNSSAVINSKSVIENKLIEKLSKK